LELTTSVAALITTGAFRALPDLVHLRKVIMTALGQEKSALSE
jgi:hypothetical protein